MHQDHTVDIHTTCNLGYHFVTPLPQLHVHMPRGAQSFVDSPLSNPLVPSSSFGSIASTATKPFGGYRTDTSAGGDGADMRLPWAVEDSLDALSYSVAWYLSRVASTRGTRDDMEIASNAVPRLVSSRASYFDDLLVFCRCVLHQLADLVRLRGLMPRVQRGLSEGGESLTDAASSVFLTPDESDVISRATLRTVVEACVDVATMLCGGFTPPSVPSSQSFSPPPAAQRAGSVVAEAVSPLRGSSSRPQAANEVASSLVERCLNPFTVTNLFACGLLDALVGITLTDAASTPTPEDDDTGADSVMPTEAQANEAFLVMSVILGTDPEDLLERFLEYLRIVPYPLRRKWTHPLPSLVRRLVIDERRVVVEAASETSYAVAVHRKMLLQQSITGKQMETAGPGSPRSNMELSEMWRYVM